MRKKIVFTGGTGRFAKVFKKISKKEKVYFPKKNELNIENLNSINKYFGKKFKPYIIGKIVKNSKKVKLSGKISW